MGNKPKTLHFYIFGCEAYVFLPSEVYANKLVLYSELMIFIGYKDNIYCFICHIQGNIIFHSTHAIFNERLFSKYTDFHAKECKLYNKLLDKISLEIELLVSDSFRKDRPTLVSIPHTSIPSIQNNPSACSFSLSLSYKFISLLSTLRFKNLIVEIEENDNVDSNVEMQLPSLQ